MKSILSYKNEDDKCYGATGMAISIMVYDSDEYLSAISIDAEPGEIMEMMEDFYFSGNPGLSATNAWKQMLKSFNLGSAMAIGNLLCRSIVLHNTKPDADMHRALLEAIVNEGTEACSLDEEESKQLFNKNFNYLYRVFNHRGIASVAHDFARKLKESRRLTRLEVLEELRGLRSL